MSEYEQRIVQIADERKEIVEMPDGCVYYHPSAETGLITSHQLMILSEEVRRRNAAIWNNMESDPDNTVYGESLKWQERGEALDV